MSNYVPPGAQYQYKPPSVFARYKALSIIFALLLITLLLYGVMAPRHDRRYQAPTPAPLPAPSQAPAATPPASAPTATAPLADPVYVLPVPPKGQSDR